MNKVSVYRALASRLQAIENCGESGNREWLAKHKARAFAIVREHGRELSVDPFTLAHAEPGAYPGIDEKAVLTLAREYQRAEDSDYVYISWGNQVKASDYFNTHGLVNTLDEIVRIGGSGALS